MPPKSTSTKSTKSTSTKSTSTKSKSTSPKSTNSKDINEFNIINFDNLDLNKNNKNDYEIKSDYRNIISDYDSTKNTSSNKLTIYEATLLIGKRITQLSFNIEPLVEHTENDNIEEIVIRELKERKTPFMIKRKIGGKTEYWKLEDMVIDEELFSIL